MKTEPLNALPLCSVVLTHDGLAWQANASRDDVTYWTNTQDGYKYELSSTELAPKVIAILDDAAHTLRHAADAIDELLSDGDRAYVRRDAALWLYERAERIEGDINS